MPEPISIAITLFVGYGALASYRRNDSSTSTEGQAAVRAVNEVLGRGQTSQALFGEKAQALASLRKICEECETADWDEPGTLPVELPTSWNADDFIRALPPDVPMPELSAAPDGSVVLDWIVSRKRMFSVSINSSPKVAFAWLDEDSNGHGVSTFNSGVIPFTLVAELRKILMYGETPVRTA